ncbi:MAG: hypothetical protein ACRDH8_10660 [Actinomycetota bacterium]
MAILGAACNGSEEPSEQASPPATSPTAPVSPTAAPASPSPAPEGSPGRTGEVQSDIETRHPNGTLLRIPRVVFGADYIQVEINATNANDDSVELNAFSDDTVMIDDLGNVYRLSPPPENPEVRIEPRSGLQGTLVFLPGLHREATGLTLAINNELGNPDYEEASDPLFRIGIPLEGLSG